MDIFQKKLEKDENSKITAQSVKDYLLKVDELKTLETTLSTQLQPERYNGFMNLVRLFNNPDATTEEIEKSLVNYKYNYEIFKRVHSNVSNPCYAIFSELLLRNKAIV